MRRGVWTLSVPWILAIAGIALLGCGGGGGGGGTNPVPTATIQGSVSGTIVLALDETGKIVDQDDTAGKTPLPGSSPPKYPFSLTVNAGHQYTFQFLVDEGTATERVLPLYQNGMNIFSVASAGTLDLGFVNTTGLDNAFADNSVLTPIGKTPPPTIKLQGYRYFFTRNGPTGNVTAKFHVEVRDPGGTTPVTNRSLIKDVAFFDNAWNSLPLSGAFALWNGTDMYFDPPSPPALTPTTDIEATLVKAPSVLAAGFYNVVVTDNAGNLHKAQVYFRQPDAVLKPSNLAQTINTLDNSITLTWENPDLTGVPGTKYAVYLSVTSDDLNGDGIADSRLFVRRNTASFTSYTIPGSFVASNLAGKSGLKWHVQIRQYDDTVVYPDGTSQGATTQFYRNYSAESPLTLPGQSLAFTSGMLSGKVFFLEDLESDLLFFNAGGSFTIDFDDHIDPPVKDTGTWSINPSGQLDISFSVGGGVIATLLSETTTALTVLTVEKGTGFTETSVLQKTVPIDGARLPGTYSYMGGGSTIFNSDFTGNDPDFGSFTWSVDGAGKLTMNWSTGGSKSFCYSLATSTSTSTAYSQLNTACEEVSSVGVLEWVYSWDLTRSP